MSETLDSVSVLKNLIRKKQDNRQKSYEPVQVIEAISTDEFIETYEKQNIPVMIKNFPLNWKAFEKWDRNFITEKFCINNYKKYLANFPQLSFSNRKTNYLRDIPIEENRFLEEDYSIPPFFADASYQPDKYRWIFLGPPSSMTEAHIDVEECHAWNVSIYGSKYWWFFPDKDRVLTGIAEPGDIVFTPGGMYHGVVNLQECLSVTHDYKR
ncbi:hypothetical protein [Roseofilum capinflatum]|uniref:JmjC domain-containing protein n=1 Tax=Roseofilum capinflatum BLCC-M114 TaxID=3022440 RepID=A0ABT7B5F1_9CYAN|nr:hypothetical protein [Roseofilum capinflatum]MDJ1174356.1 hypothetical protein [Roseofilum capinflatum BLCC-M114]